MAIGDPDFSDGEHKRTEELRILVVGCNPALAFIFGSRLYNFSISGVSRNEPQDLISDYIPCFFLLSRKCQKDKIGKIYNYLLFISFLISEEEGMYLH